MEMFASLKTALQTPRHAAQQVLNFGMIVATALFIWKSLCVVTASESPIVVVLTGSMEPLIHRGDLLFLWQHSEDRAPLVGDIVVYKNSNNQIPIVHRILEVHEGKTFDDTLILTKGDNNVGDDRALYPRGQLWLSPSHIIGTAKLFLPHVGYVTILMNESPMFKYLLIGTLGFFAIITRGE